MNSLHLFFIQLTTFLSLGLNVYLYTHMLELTKILKDKTIADKILFEKLESKIALVPAKVLDNPVAAKIQIITQSESFLGYVYLGVSVVVLVGLLYFLYSSYIALSAFFSTKSILASLGAGICNVVNVVPDKHIIAQDLHGTYIKLDITTQLVEGKQTELFTLSIKRVGDVAYQVIDNIGSLIVENPEVTAKALEAADAFVAVAKAANF